jgi:hypothetical protein
MATLRSPSRSAGGGGGRGGKVGGLGVGAGVGGGAAVVGHGMLEVYVVPAGREKELYDIVLSEVDGAQMKLETPAEALAEPAHVAVLQIEKMPLAALNILDQVGGTLPVRPALSWSTRVASRREPQEEGRLPSREFPPRRSTVRFAKADQLEGKAPVSELL